jgi:hypothetical protein
MTHMIRQQCVRVEVNGTEADGLSLQRRLPDLCQQALNPAVERVLDRYMRSDRHLSIDRLDIDAGTMSLERLERELTQAVELALERSLRELILVDGASTASESGKIRYQTEQQRIHEAFVYFLKTGSLPWWFRLPHDQSLDQVVLDSWRQFMKAGFAPLDVTDAVRRVLQSPASRKRLIRQCSFLVLETLLSLLSPESEHVVSEIRQTLRRPIMSPLWTEAFERSLWETVFAYAAVRHAVISTDLVGEAFRALPVTGTQRVGLVGLLEQHWPGAVNKAPAHHTIRSAPTPQTLPPSGPTPLDTEDHPEAREGLYVENAGLVLLHPFLPQFFSGLGIADQGRLLQPDRALSLLHVLATGRTIAPEYGLVLPKILCHVPLGMPVELNIELTPGEREETCALLEAVIRHWQALRNTSPDGLRGVFLLRPGKVLLRDDGDWFLQVESRTHDILLDQLPWGLSMIKLPWMRRMLRVEWR